MAKIGKLGIKLRIVAGWTWWDSVSAGFLGLCVGAVVVHLLHIADIIEPWRLTQLLFTLGGPLIKLFGCLFFFGRAWSIARIPSNKEHKANWGKLDWKQMIVTGLFEKYISIAMVFIALAFGVALAPDILQVGMYFKE